MTNESWVPETRFGIWFQRTSIWRQYVLGRSLDELLGLLAGDRPAHPRVLDLGCGDGAAFQVLERELAPRSILGIDVDAESIAHAHAFATSCRTPVHVRVGDATRLGLEPASLDLVLCHQLLHHLHDAHAALREVHRVLAPGGWLLVSESCRSFIELWRVRGLFRHPMSAQRSAEEFASLLSESGFEVTPERTAKSAPWWSRRDLGLLGVEPKIPTQISIAARRL